MKNKNQALILLTLALILVVSVGITGCVSQTGSETNISQSELSNEQQIKSFCATNHCFENSQNIDPTCSIYNCTQYKPSFPEEMKKPVLKSNTT